MNLRQLAFTAQVALNSVVGYLFIKALAFSVGVSAQKDAFDIAYSVPFIIMNVTGFSFLHGIVVKQFSRMIGRGNEDLGVVFSSMLNLFLLVGFFTLALTCLGVSPLTRILAPGLSSEARIEAEHMILLMLPLVFTLGAATFISAVLTAFSVPVSMEFAQLLGRAIVLIWAWRSDFHFELTTFSAMLTAFSTIPLLIQFWMLKRYTPIRYSFQLSLNDPELQSVARQAFGMVVAAIAAQLSGSYVRRLATLSGPGMLATFTYAVTIVSPLSILIGKPLALTFGPDYVREFESGRGRAASSEFWRTVGITVLLTAIIALAVSALSDRLVALMYGGGQFSAASVSATAEIVRTLAWMLPPATLLWVNLMPLLNHRFTHLAAWIYLVGYVAQIPLAGILFQHMGVNGLAWSYVLTTLIQSVVGIVSLRWAGKSAGEFLVRA